MPSFKEKYGPWAVVAGGAEGLGEAYSMALAKRKFNLLLIDNQEAALEQLAKKLSGEYEISVMTLVLDLARQDAVTKIAEKTAALDAGLLVYNAAFSRIKPFLHHSPEELDQFVSVNAKTQLKLVHAFTLQLMNKKRKGGILMMSSLAGLIGMQLVAPYAATKAFTWNLAEAIHHELKPKGIDVTACVAGVIATKAYLQTNPVYGRIKPKVMQPSEVAESALQNLGKKYLFMPGTANRISYFFLTRCLPRKWASSIANQAMKKMYPDF
jgi:uncharacterized protein